MTYWMYILQCSDGSYYTGHTDALDYRIAQHDQGAIPGCHTQSRRPVQLVFSQGFGTREEASLAERRVKGWRREKKEALIAGRYDLLPLLAPTAREPILRQAQDERMREAGAKGVLGPVRDERGARETEGKMVLRQAQDERLRGAGEKSVVGPARDENLMHRALALADRAESEDDEIPVGAVLIDAAGDVIGEGWNRNIAEHDPTAHAEILAMRAAGKRLGNHRLVGCTLYVTLEPCAMCAMAVVHARVARVVYAASDPKTGAAGSVFDLLADPRHNHRVQVQGGVLADEAGKRLTNYFRRKRGKVPLA